MIGYPLTCWPALFLHSLIMCFSLSIFLPLIIVIISLALSLSNLTFHSVFFMLNFFPSVQYLLVIIFLSFSLLIPATLTYSLSLLFRHNCFPLPFCNYDRSLSIYMHIYVYKYFYASFCLEANWGYKQIKIINLDIFNIPPQHPIGSTRGEGRGAPIPPPIHLSFCIYVSRPFSWTSHSKFRKPIKI